MIAVLSSLTGLEVNLSYSRWHNINSKFKCSPTEFYRSDHFVDAADSYSNDHFIDVFSLVVIQSKSLVPHPWMEVYSDGVIRFIGILDHETDFYVPETGGVVTVAQEKTT